MGRVVAVEYLTLDGVMEAPAWSGPYFDPFVGEFQADNLFPSDALLLGRVTYEGFKAAWPGMADDPADTIGFGKRMNDLPKFVATRTLTEPEWNATFLEGDAVDAVAALRADAEVGTLLINGSGALLRDLIAGGLVDELRLMIFPVLVGAGGRLFSTDEAAHAWQLTQSRTSPSGVVILNYEPAAA